MRKTFITLAALIALAALLVPSALGASVSVRVEGRTLSIFGSLETRFEAGANPMQALDLASLRGEFYYHVTTTSFGPYVDQIGRHSAGGTNGWVFKVNGASPPVGADQVQLNDGDRVLWYWATFGPTGGPPTLHLTLSAATAPSLPELLEELSDAVAAARMAGPVAVDPGLAVLVADIDPAALDDEGFGRLLGAAGLAGADGALALPERMAPVNALLDACPPPLREALLLGVLDRLSRPTPA